MAALRFIAGLLMLIAVIAFITDLTRPLSGAGPFVPTTIARQWQALAPSSMQAAKAAVSKATHPLVWDPLIAAPIGLPLFVLFGGLAGLAGYAGRRRNRVNIYRN